MTLINETYFNIIVKPCVTEKSNRIGDVNKQVMFIVRREATKPQIKAAVEKLFSVEVKSVNVSVLKGKVKTFRQKLGRRQDVKKAFVTLKPGFDINFQETDK